MTAYLIRRLLLMIPTVIGISFLVFMLVALSPGGVKARLAAGSGDAAVRAVEEAYLARRYGLDAPVIVQYGRWLARLSPIRAGEDGGVVLALPDLGNSFTRHRPVADVMAEALPATLMLNVLAFIVACLVAIPMGCVAGVRRGTWIDAGLRVVFIGLWSIPVVAAAVLLQGLLAGRAGWLPLSGLHGPDSRAMPFGVYLADALRHLVLPVACLAYGSLALLSRQTRAAVLEQIHSDHVRTARAKGLPESAVFARHTLRNSLLPMITLLAAMAPTLLSGSIIVERVFNLPGMGGLLLEAIELRDREVLMACVLMASLVNVAAMLAADVLYAAADPRVTYRGAA